MNEFYFKFVPKIVIGNFLIGFHVLVTPLDFALDLISIREVIQIMIGAILIITVNSIIIMKRKKELEAFSTKMYFVFVVILPAITPIIMHKITHILSLLFCNFVW